MRCIIFIFVSIIWEKYEVDAPWLNLMVTPSLLSQAKAEDWLTLNTSFLAISSCPSRLQSWKSVLFPTVGFCLFDGLAWQREGTYFTARCSIHRKWPIWTSGSNYAVSKPSMPFAERRAARVWRTELYIVYGLAPRCWRVDPCSLVKKRVC